MQAARDKADKALVPYAAVDQSTRNAVSQLRNSRANWTPDELAALNEAAAGSPTQRALRMVGMLSPTSPIAGEFVNVGIVLHSATGLSTYGRVAGVFPTLDEKAFKGRCAL